MCGRLKGEARIQHAELIVRIRVAQLDGARKPLNGLGRVFSRAHAVLQTPRRIQLVGVGERVSDLDKSSIDGR